MFENPQNQLEWYSILGKCAFICSTICLDTGSPIFGEVGIAATKVQWTNGVLESVITYLLAAVGIGTRHRMSHDELVTIFSRNTTRTDGGLGSGLAKKG